MEYHLFSATLYGGDITRRSGLFLLFCEWRRIRSSYLVRVDRCIFRVDGRPGKVCKFERWQHSDLTLVTILPMQKLDEYIIGFDVTVANTIR